MKDLQLLFEAGNSEELVRRGTEFFREGEEEKAFEYYRAACKLGNVVAMGNLGYCYQAGRGVRADNRLAAYCFERASELEDPGSMLKLGDFYYNGKGGLEKDPSRAFGYYLHAYEIAANSAEADPGLISDLCYRLATCKRKGCGTAQNIEEAYEYYQAAAEAVADDAMDGEIRAQAILQKAEAGMEACERLL